MPPIDVNNVAFIAIGISPSTLACLDKLAKTGYRNILCIMDKKISSQGYVVLKV